MKRAFGCLTIFLLLALAVSIFFNLLLLGGSASGLGKSRGDFEEIHLYGNPLSSDKIAVIDIAGIISASTPGEVYTTQLDDYTFMLRQALNDPAVKAIVLRIDSPGGEVTASDILFHAVLEADRQKPVLAFLQSIGTSGAYYTAIGARHISANSQTITGSIGVILQTFNMQGLAEKIGIGLVTFKSGELKDLLNPLRPVTEAERSLFQALIDESYDRFVGLVAERRKLPVDALKKGVADGRVLSGTQAKEAGLIDSTGYFADTLQEAIRLGQADEDAAVVELQAPLRFKRLFRIFGQSSENRPLSLRIGPPLPELLPGRLYYLAGHLFSPAP
ncbi:MAG: hypothetical protein OHK005_06320 [Candidatus Methylacidiphilales bacterium]